MENSSETLVIPKSEAESNNEIIPKTELDTENSESYKNIDEMGLLNTHTLLIQPKLEFPAQNENDPTIIVKLEPDLEVPSSVEPLLEPYIEPYIELHLEHNLEAHLEVNAEAYVEPKSEPVSEEAAHFNPLLEPPSVAQDEDSNTTFDDSDELPNLSVDGEESSSIDSLFRTGIMEMPVLVTEDALSPVTITEELPSTTAEEATANSTIEEVVDVESGWPPQVVDLTEEEGPADTDIVEVLQVEENVIYDGSVSRNEERRRRRRRKRERREQRAINSNSDFSHDNETIEINDFEIDVEDLGAASTSGASGTVVVPVTVDIEAFTVPESPPDRLSPPPLRQTPSTSNDIPFMNNPTQNHNMEIDFQDPNLLFGSLLASPVLEHVDDGIPFLQPNSPDIFPMAHLEEQQHEQIARAHSPELFDLIPMERPPRPIRRTRMATRNAAAAAAADRSRSRSPLGDDNGAAAADEAAIGHINYAVFERLLDDEPPAAGPPRRMFMGLPDFAHNSNMDLQHLHLHLPPQPRPHLHPLQHHQPAAAATAAPIPPPRVPSPPPRAGSLSCPICLDTLGSIQAQRRNLVSTVCGHVFCSHCLEESLKARKECPTCRKKLTKKQYHPIYI